MSKKINFKKETIIDLQNPINFYDIIVIIDSLFSLKDIGWKMKYTDQGFQTYLSKKHERSCVIGIVGNSNIGKTFILQKFAGCDLPSGYSLHTEGLSIKYPTIQEKNVILLDSAGLETPLRQREDLPIDKDMDCIASYNLLKDQVRNKELTDLFIQKFVLFKADIIIAVVGQLTYSDQKLIGRIKADNLYRQKEKNKQLFIIHNLLHLETIAEVNHYIEETLLTSLTFQLIQNNMIFNNKIGPNSSKPRNSKYYIEIVQDINESVSSVIHLIMAREHSEAGDYYNKSALNFLRNSCAQYTLIDEFPLLDKIKEHLCALSRDLIENPIRSEDIEVSDKAIRLSRIRDPETGEEYNGPVRLNKCFIDEIGNSTFSRHFTPTYSVSISNELLVIEIEISGQVINFNPKVLRMARSYCFQIKGEKVIEYSKEPKELSSSRDSGKFLLEIIMPVSEILVKSKIGEVKNKNGLWSISYSIEKNDNQNNEEEIIFD